MARGDGVHPVEGGPVLTYEVRLPISPDAAWAFFTDAGFVVRWMGSVATVDARPGGVFRVEYRSGDVVAGSYLEVDRPRHVTVTWGWEEPGAAVPPGGSRLEIDLEEDEAPGTIVRLRHLGLSGDSLRTHDEGWRFFLPRLVEAASAT